VIALSRHFQRSVLTLQADSALRSLAVLALVVTLLTAWVAWFARARVGVYAASDSARLQVDREPHPVGAPMGGRVMTTSLAVGRLVEAGEVLIELATSARLAFDVEQRRIRAPIRGTLAEISPLRAGTMVATGERICTIVPEGILKVVALFQPSVALGRVRAGQPARVRFDGFPWTQYGSTTARVSNVAAELRDGRIRVELTFDAGVLTSIPRIPYQHGLTALVDVEIERVSPATLVLRSAGLWPHERATTTQ
jgi:multidrug efflux pump subunit AcrA (membrane-fusion protein)